VARVLDSPRDSQAGDVLLDAAAAAAALQDAADEREQLMILKVMVKDLKVGSDRLWQQGLASGRRRQ
jgi:hypothetical protein